MNQCKNIIQIGISSQSFKEFIGLLNTYPENEIRYKDLFEKVLVDLIHFMSNKPSREIFYFSGKPYSGIGLLALKELPKDGYCFCGSIRFEHKGNGKEIMTIFKLGASKKREIEFFIKDGYLHYTVIFYQIIVHEIVRREWSKDNKIH